MQLCEGSKKGFLMVRNFWELCKTLLRQASQQHQDSSEPLSGDAINLLLPSRASRPEYGRSGL